MSTTIRPELSEKNKYWIDRNRYYELKHFCLQYSDWKKAYEALDGLNKKHSDLTVATSNIGDPTANTAEIRASFLRKMQMVEQAAFEADPDLANYIFRAVTEGITYMNFKSRLNIPCCRDTYYEVYRRFFWLLSKARD